MSFERLDQVLSGQRLTRCFVVHLGTQRQGGAVPGRCCCTVFLNQYNSSQS